MCDCAVEVIDRIWEVLEPDVRERAKIYTAKKELRQLFEALAIGILWNEPEDTLVFIAECMERIRCMGRARVKWDTFIQWDVKDNACDWNQCSTRDPDDPTFSELMLEHYDFLYKMPDADRILKEQEKKHPLY